MIMKCCVQWNRDFDWKNFRLQRVPYPGPLDQQTRAQPTELTGILFITVDWLVVLGLKSLETVFQSISGRLPKRGGKRRERIDES